MASRGKTPTPLVVHHPHTQTTFRGKTARNSVPSVVKGEWVVEGHHVMKNAVAQEI